MNDLLNKKFGKLTVIEKAQRPENMLSAGVYWLCKCDCGNNIIVNGQQLLRKRFPKQSCGCTNPKENFMKIISKRRMVSDMDLLYNRYFNSAKQSNRCFDLSRDFFEEIIFKNCFYCGRPPMKALTRSRRDEVLFYYSGIDRINNNIGYTEQNSVPCCEHCNRAKLKMEKQDFYSWIKQVFTNLSEKGEI